jgi:hypothetical protein
MLYVQQPAFLRMTRALLIAGAAAVLLAFPGAVAAQTAPTPCYEMIPARPRIEPPAPMLVDKCSGRTWLLQRAGRGSYRWVAIVADDDMPKATDRPPTDNQPASKADNPSAEKEGDGTKCFTFNNRKFCE